ncbi:helix-turn-helix domain-containing protein [Streptomyces abikoensis]|uniref:helix-turn-helix domain-containing protein n=1 Tax=Streptomyces abikoensis TaxID=97398 RepID=UPI0037224228
MGDQMAVTVIQEAHSAELAFRAPHPLLAGHVLGYTGQSFSLPQPRVRRVTALAAVMLLIDFETPVRHLVTDTGQQQSLPLSPVSGLSDRPLIIRQSGREHGVVVLLTPLGARALFRLPLQELARRNVHLTDLLGPDGRRLTEQLAEAPDWPTRFRTIDAFLLARIGAGPELPLQVRRAWRRLIGAGAAPISTLADEVGWSRQHLNVRFSKEIGLSPKTLARIARLQRAMALMRSTRPPSLADVAAMCGYTDQSHLNRDFRLLTGCTPARFRTLTNDWFSVYIADPRVYPVDGAPSDPQRRAPARGPERQAR